MSTKDNLLEKEISLDNIANYCKDYFNCNRTDFSKDFLGNTSMLSRIRKDKARIPDSSYKLMFDYIKQKSGGTSASFVEMLQTWFPTLKNFRTEEAIIRKIKAELKGNPSDYTIIEDIPQNYSTIEFIRFCTENNSSIKNLYLVAQTGWEWLDDKELNSVLMELAQNGKKIIVITNPETDATISIANAIKDEKLKFRYMSLNDTLAKWHEYEEEFKNIELKVSELPILHQIVIIEHEEKTAYALVREYIYGIPVGSTTSQIFSKNRNSDYDLYYKEFNYLRNHAQSYAKWLESSPMTHEEMPVKDYVLIYPAHKETVDKKRRWVFSSLSIQKNNTVSLKVNMSESHESFSMANSYEYKYRGIVNLSPKMLFLTMTDDKQVERVSISFARPIKNNDYLIGILTALSPGGVPLSFKCACFDEKDLKYINYDNLYRLLTLNYTETNNNLIKIGSEDMEEFYSDNILNGQLKLFSRCPESPFNF